jgi:hypothetical protein
MVRRKSTNGMVVLLKLIEAGRDFLSTNFNKKSEGNDLKNNNTITVRIDQIIESIKKTKKNINTHLTRKAQKINRLFVNFVQSNAEYTKTTKFRNMHSNLLLNLKDFIYISFENTGCRIKTRFEVNKRFSYFERGPPNCFYTYNINSRGIFMRER